MLVHGFVAALTLGSALTAGPEAAELRWSAPAGCPSMEQVHGWLGRLVSSAGPTELRVRVTVEPVAAGFAGIVELGDERVRRLEAEDCAVLARAIAVVIAVSLDPVAAIEAIEAPVAPEPARPSRVGERAPSPRAARAAVGEDEHAREPGRPRPPTSDGQTGGGRPLELGARLGGGMGGLLLPGASLGLLLAPFIGTRRLHVRAVAQYWAPQRVAFDPQRDASGEVQLVSGGVRVCPQLARPHVRIPLCAGVDAGAVLGRGTGRDLAPSRTAQEPWVGAVLEPGVVLAVTSRLSLWLALEGVVSLQRPRFAVGGAPRSWTAGAGALRGLLGLQIHGHRSPPERPRKNAAKIP